MGSRGLAVVTALAVLATLGPVVPADAEAPTTGPDASADADASEDATEEETVEEREAREREEAQAEAVELLRDAEADLAAARRDVADRRADVSAARAASRAAEGGLREAEEELPDLVRSHRDLAREHDTLEDRLVDLAERRVVLLGELTVAEDVLAERAVRTFKAGQLSSVTGPVAALREARDPGELARGLADLRTLTRDGARTVHEVRRELRDVETRSAESERRSVEIGDLLADAETAADDAERDAQAAREAEHEADARLVDALDAELRARDAVEVAEGALADALAEARDLDAPLDDVEVAGDDIDGDAGDVAGAAVPETRVAAERDARRRAHERATRLDADRRRTAEDWACPVLHSRFVNDWAFPRSGGRRHEGTDVFAARGTEIVAVTDGVVTVLDPTDSPGDLGGITVTIADGDSRQYYAHLQRIEPTLRVGDEVAAGDRVGWVGDSGNARTTPPHLHLGWYVDDVAVNPFASLAVACWGEDEADTPDEPTRGLIPR